MLVCRNVDWFGFLDCCWTYYLEGEVMDIQKIPTLAEKQEFWAEQLPNFEATYWLPSHFEYVIFDMEQGNYVIKDDLSPDFEGDATEIWHRVNTGWAMWKKAINFGRKQPQAVPEGFVLVDKHQLAQLMANMDSFGKKALGDDYVSFADIAAVLDEAQEPTND